MYAEDGEGVVMVSAGHVGGTRGSGIVSNPADVLWIRRFGGVCEMCMCLARGNVDGEVVSGLGFTNPVKTGGMLYVCLCFGGVGG